MVYNGNAYKNWWFGWVLPPPIFGGPPHIMTLFENMVKPEFEEKVDHRFIRKFWRSKLAKVTSEDPYESFPWRVCFQGMTKNVRRFSKKVWNSERCPQVFGKEDDFYLQSQGGNHTPRKCLHILQLYMSWLHLPSLGNPEPVAIEGLNKEWLSIPLDGGI